MKSINEVQKLINESIYNQICLIIYNSIDYSLCHSLWKSTFPKVQGSTKNLVEDSFVNSIKELNSIKKLNENQPR